jgi:predicted DNA-binding transcriptional regulator AlpA
VVESDAFSTFLEGQRVDDLVDRREAAQLLRVSQRTLDRWHLLGDGPPRVQCGPRTIRYRLTSICEWLCRRETVGPRKD